MPLIDELMREGYLRTPTVIAAFRRIQRKDFLRPGEEGEAEKNAPLLIGHKQTISQPLTVAFMLEHLRPAAGDRVLDVGSGSGWTAALLADIAGERGEVHAVERIPALKEFGERNADKYGFVSSGRIVFHVGNGYGGLPDRAPFDKILVSASAPVLPPALLDQLKIGGRMVMPVGDWYAGQDLVVVEKLAPHKFAEERYPGFVFVPLLDDNN